MLDRLPVAELVAAQEKAPGCTQFDLLMPAVLVAILYFVWIRPSQNERKKHQELLDSLKRGDEILTQTGMLGTVADIQDKVVVLEVARNVKIRMLKTGVLRKIKGEDDDEKAK